MRLLVVAAYPPELAAFADIPRQRPRPKPATASATVPMPSWMSAPGDASPTFMTHAVGIGVVEAAAGAARAIAKHEPDFVLLVGTCGFYDRSKLTGTTAAAAAAPKTAPLAIGQVVVLGVTALVDPAVTLGVAATLPPISKLHVADGELLAEVSSSGSSHSGGPALAAVRVATTASLTTSDEVAARLSEQWDVEHLESAGVATACKAAAVRFGAILGIANRVGSTGRDEWAKHRQSAEQATGATARILVDRWRSQ
jgi:nucleoside phosphorylase